MMVRQIGAILLDSLRFLRSQWLFWIALFFSLLIALLLFGTLRFSEDGWRMLWFSINESDILYEGSFATRALMSWLFGGAFVYWWLAWGAIIVGLISTASIMPNLASRGSIELLDSKPIHRVTLLWAKIGGGLLFMIVQVSLGVLAAYVLLGLRYGMWFHSALWAIPLLTVQFLYLYAVLSLLGVITRSALASLLAVLVFWGVISLTQFAGSQIDQVVTQAELTVERNEERIARTKATAEEDDRELRNMEERNIARWERQIESHQDTIDMVGPWQQRVNRGLLFVPKTADVQRIISGHVNAPTFQELVMILQGLDEDGYARMVGLEDDEDVEEFRAALAAEREGREVDAVRSIGSSLGFVAVILLLTTVIFVRRDF